MLRKIENVHLICTLVLTLLANTLQAQQNNKPQTTPAVTPTVKQTPGPYGSNVKINYVRTWEPNGPITDPNAIPSADYTNVFQLLSTSTAWPAGANGWSPQYAW